MLFKVNTTSQICTQVVLYLTKRHVVFYVVTNSLVIWCSSSVARLYMVVH